MCHTALVQFMNERIHTQPEKSNSGSVPGRGETGGRPAGPMCVAADASLTSSLHAGCGELTSRHVVNLLRFKIHNIYRTSINDVTNV